MVICVVMKLVIVVVEGVVVGVGFLFVFVCDLIVVVYDVKFVMLYVCVGLMFDGGGLWFFVCVLLCVIVVEILFEGKLVVVECLYVFGVVNWFVMFGMVLSDVLVWVDMFVGILLNVFMCIKLLFDDVIV